MFEQLLIGLIFLGAVAYLGRRAWKSLFRKRGRLCEGMRVQHRYKSRVC